MFEINDLLNTEFTGANSTEYENIPENVYTAAIEKIEPVEFDAKEPKYPGEKIASLNVHWVIDDPALAEQLGRNKLVSRQTVWLDRTESGSLDMGKGKNVQLGKLRDAIGANTDGAFRIGSWIGAVAKVQVKHRKNDGKTYAEVVSVAKMS
jgi:hypothetical protein